jgi:hypothetical protein
MTVRKAQFPSQVWDGRAVDRDSRLHEIDPRHPSYDQLVAELIATQTYTLGLVGGLTDPYSSEAADNLIKGMPVYIDGTGRLQKAQNNLISAHQVVGLMISDAGIGQAGSYLTDGPVERLDWTPITGTVDLVPGQLYYLDSVPGMLTPTAPTEIGYYVVPVGRAQTVRKLDIEIGQPIRL